MEGSKSSDSGSNDDEGSGDPMMNEAIKCVVEAGQASTALLQRRLRLGYARAGRLIDEMEQMGIVGSARGARSPRAKYSLITYAQWLEMNMQKQDTPVMRNTKRGARTAESLQARWYLFCFFWRSVYTPPGRAMWTELRAHAACCRLHRACPMPI